MDPINLNYDWFDVKKIRILAEENGFSVTVSLSGRNEQVDTFMDHKNIHAKILFSIELERI